MPQPRTNEPSQQDKQASIEVGVVSSGIKGFRLIARISSFYLVWFLCPDNMHGVLVGGAPKFGLAQGLHRKHCGS